MRENADDRQGSDARCACVGACRSLTRRITRACRLREKCGTGDVRLGLMARHVEFAMDDVITLLTAVRPVVRSVQMTGLCVAAAVARRTSPNDLHQTDRDIHRTAPAGIPGIAVERRRPFAVHASLYARP